MPDQFVTMLTDIAKAAEEASPMRASSLIRRRGDQRRTRQRAAVGVLAIAAVGAIAATGSALGMHRTANNLPATPPSVTASPTPIADPTATASSTASPSSSSISADLAVTATDVVLTKAAGDTRWRGELVMTVQAKTGSTDQARLTFDLNPGIGVLVAPHPGGDPTGSLAQYHCTHTNPGETGTYACNLGPLNQGQTTTVRLKLDTDMPGLTTTPQAVTVTALTADGTPLTDPGPADNTTHYATRIA